MEDKIIVFRQSKFFKTSSISDFFKKSDFWLILTIQKLFVLFGAKSVPFMISMEDKIIVFK